MERVNEWQSYLGRSETPHEVGAAPKPATADSQEFSAIRESAVTPSAPPHTDVNAAPVEVLPPPQVEKNGSASTSATVIEVLPPAVSARVVKEIPRRQIGERELKGALFNDTRHAEAEYNHARRANAVLSVFVIMLLAVIFTVISWLVVD